MRRLITLTVFGHEGRRYGVAAASGNLVPAQWQQVTTFILTGPFHHLPVPLPTENTFYRAYEAAGTGLLAAPGRLRIRRTEAGVRLEWPGDSDGWQLEQTDRLGPQMRWRPVATPIRKQSGVWTVELPVSDRTSYFRLTRPTDRKSNTRIPQTSD